MPEIRRFNWENLPPKHREQMSALVRSFGLDPKDIAVGFTLVSYSPRLWQLHLTEHLRNKAGRHYVGADGVVASRPVVRQIDPPVFLLTTIEEAS